MNWYDRSRQIIAAQQAENPGLSRCEMRRFCSRNYPFFERKGWAYKAWLRAMRDVFGKPGKVPPPEDFELE